MQILIPELSGQNLHQNTETYPINLAIVVNLDVRAAQTIAGSMSEGECSDCWQHRGAAAEACEECCLRRRGREDTFPPVHISCATSSFTPSQHRTAGRQRPKCKC